MAIKIPLTRGFVAVVDDEDSHYASSSWHAHGSRGLVYARRSRRTPGTRKVTKEYLHRLILNEPEGRVDHVDGDTLNNRRSNLRRATGTQNQGNSKLRRDNTTGYKGVSRVDYQTTKGPVVAWTARCRRRSLGIFDTAKEAAIGYDCEAIVAFGAFAKLNEDPWRYIVGCDLAESLERDEAQAQERELRARLKAAVDQRKALQSERRA